MYDDDGNKVGNKDHCYFFADSKITRDGDYLPTDMFDGNYHTIGVLWTKEEYIFYYDGYEMYRTDCKNLTQIQTLITDLRKKSAKFTIINIINIGTIFFNQNINWKMLSYDIHFSLLYICLHNFLCFRISCICSFHRFVYSS